MADRGFHGGSGVPKRRTIRQYQALVGPITSAVPAAPAIPHHVYPDRLDPAKRLTPEAFAFQPPPDVPTLPHLLQVIPVRSWRVLPGEFAWHPETPATVTQPWMQLEFPVRALRLLWGDLVWNPSTPAPVVVPDLVSPSMPEVVRLRPFIIPPSETRQPIFPITQAPIWPARGIVGTIPERSCASYIATLTDPFGQVLPGSILQTLRLTLYAINRDNTLTIVNNRLHQACLNMNEVTVYDALQTTGDGRTYNLRWRITAADTTLVDPALKFERHIALFEWSWADGSGKQEVIVVVQNLTSVN